MTCPVVPVRPPHDRVVAFTHMPIIPVAMENIVVPLIVRPAFHMSYSRI